MRRLFILTVATLSVAATSAPVAASADTGQHGAIYITSDDQFTAPGSGSGCQCVTAGNGSSSSPYVIGPWAFTAPSGGSSGYAIKVDNSSGNVNKSFIISGISANYSGVLPPDPVIWLVDVNNAAISNVSANEDGIGVRLDGSSYITLDQLSFNKMAGTGLYIDQNSSNITVWNSKFKSTADGALETQHYADGIYAADSSWLSIGGVPSWPIIGGVPACPATQICNSFDYDSGFGVYLKNTHDVTIDHASANADDTGGYVLDDSYNVTLSNSGAGSDGPICFTAGGVRTHTGYASDLQGNLMLVNGSYDNAILDDQLAAPIGGPSIGSGSNVDSAGHGVFYDPCAKADVEVSPTISPVESAMGGGNTFTGTCYFSTDIATLEPAQRCK